MKKPMRSTFAPFISAGTVFAITFTLAACGGGGDSATVTDLQTLATTVTTTTTTTVTPTPTPTPTPTSTPTPTPTSGVAGKAEGLWIQNQTGTSTYVLVEPDGQMWGFPTSNIYGSNALLAYKGNISESSGNVTGTFKDVLGLGCQTVYATCPVSGLASATSLSVSGTYIGSIPQFSFNSTTRVTNTTPVAVPTGTWNMSAAMTGNFNATGTLVIGSDMSVTASNISGCAFTGALTPVAGAQYFRLTVATVNGSCSTGITAAQINGVVFRSTDIRPTGALYVMWHDTAFTKVFWSAGIK